MKTAKPFDFFIVRSPLLSYTMTEKLEQHPSKEDSIRILKEAYRSKLLQEAVFLASPYLHSEMLNWLKSDKANDKLAKTLFKYYLRMATRSTPFGGFSGVAVGSLVAGDEVDIKRSKPVHLSLALNEESWQSVLRRLQKETGLETDLRVNLNPTLYVDNQRIKFYTRCEVEQKVVLKQVYASAPLLFMLQVTSEGKTFADLQQALIEQGAPATKAKSFLDKLLSDGFLQSPISTSAIETRRWSQNSTKTAKAHLPEALYQELERVDQILAAHKCSLPRRHKAIQGMLSAADQLDVHANLIHGDLLLETPKNTIGAKLLYQFIKQVKELRPLCQPIYHADLRTFKNRFFERYEHRMVSLLEALDPDTGIGYGNINQHYRQQDDALKSIGSQPERPPGKDRINQFILKKYTTALAKQATEIRISQEELQQLGKAVEAPESETSYILGNLLVEKDAPNHFYFSLNTAAGSSAANLITRFAHLHPNIDAGIRTIMHEERDRHGDSVLAELLYNPQNKASNIVKRPIYREYVIDINGNYQGDSHVIALADLYLYIQEGKLILWSSTKQMEVIVKLSTAHNYRSSHIIYQFLADLQFEHGGTVTNWDWGLLKDSRFLPQVRYKDLILSRATWSLTKLSATHNKQTAIAQIIEELINEYNLPETVVLIERDNELLLQLTNDMAKELLHSYLMKSDVTLTEYIFSRYDSPVTASGKNRFANEIIIPISNPSTKTTVKPPLTKHTVQRRFIPGTEWVYLKIYTGIRFTEELLVTTIPAAIAALKQLNIVEKWFFIRYDDTGQHVRLRIKCRSSAQFSTVISILQQTFEPLLHAGQIFKIQTDTYVRELERYSPEFIEQCEEIFNDDSEYIISILPQVENSNDKYAIALSTIDAILSKFFESVPAKITFCENLWKNFHDEFGQNTAILRHFNRQQTARRNALWNTDSPDATGKFRNKQLENFLTSIERLAQQISTTTHNVNTQSILASLIHMFINRLFASDQRLTEYYLYHTMLSAYKMQLAVPA